METEQIPSRSPGGHVPILYLAPWVDVGGSDTATVDWFRFLDRGRFRASLITTQPSRNRRLVQVAEYAEEVWELPHLIGGPEMPRFILDFIHTRRVRVLHIMNSRLGFELLPDVASLPNPPRVVVQFHGEEPDQAGYVRFVTTRLENLVDAFSLTTTVVNASLDTYGVPSSKRRVIPIGVDAEEEFSPERVCPFEGLDRDLVHVLFPARLTAQKDPLLMVEVASLLRSGGLAFRLHVLGDGDLEPAVRARVAELALEREVIMHGAHPDVAAWYAACDMVLMTSAFETSPTRVAYEAMAMRLPVVGPAIPEMMELVTPETGVLVDPRAGAVAYATAISALAADSGRRSAIGTAARERVRSRFAVRRMATEHEALYDELLERSSPAAASSEPRPGASPPARRGFRKRPADGSPVVSVIVICFNQGRYLDECLRSIDRQTHQPIETIVVDDCSTEPETLEALARVEREGRARLLRLPQNRGPCHARNRGIERASGRYILPLDADDLLLESGVAELVGQLEAASEEIGFVYPNLQYFGNRTDYQEMPSYNLHALLSGNFCATGCLIDGEVLERGLRYPEDIVFGHEDWDFALTLAEHGIYGEPARSKTLLVRRPGFSRNDLVEVSMPVAEVIEARHPALYARRAEIKGEWSPVLSIIALDPVGEDAAAVGELERLVAAQTCADFELLVPGATGVEPNRLGTRLRRVVSRGGSRALRLADSLKTSRSCYALAAYGSPAELLIDRALVEKVLRVLEANTRISSLALADGGPELPVFRLLDGERAQRASLRALCWTTTGPQAPPATHPLPGARPLEALARWLSASGTIQWRNVASGGGVAATDSSRNGSETVLGAPRIARRADAKFRQAASELPKCPPGVPYRMSALSVWIPPQVRWLCRHVDHRSGRYVHTNDSNPPPGFALDRMLGCLRAYPFPGTISVWARADGALEFGRDHETLDDPELLGFAEHQPLPLLDELRHGRDPETAQPLLVAGQDDPLAGAIEHSQPVGYLEPRPLRPRLPEDVEGAYGLVGLLRSVDLGARRHRYGVGEMPAGVPAGELGALFTEPTGDCEPLWIDRDGRASTQPGVLENGRPSVRDAIRWIGDPLSWRDFGPTGPKLRASARRAADSVALLASPSRRAAVPPQPAGYLLRSPTAWTLPLHGALHPVTGDQLLTTDPAEISGLGFRHAALLGHVVARPWATGWLGPIRAAAPWTARFGLIALSGEKAK